MSLCLCGEIASAQETITIAVASSLYAKMQTQTQAYEKDHDVKIRLISGSTGRLYNQIIQGAPFDVFISADDIHPKALEKKHQAMAVSSAGNGFLGLKIDRKITTDLSKLLKAKIQRIAIANPTVAPFGMATKKILVQQGLWESLQAKFIYAQNALQAKMLVEKGLVDAGFVSVSDNNDALAEVPYIAVLLSNTSSAKIFFNFLEGLQSHHQPSATKVAPPIGREPLASLSYPNLSATKVVPPKGSEALTSPNLQ